MTNKEMLRRLEDAFVRENVTHDYDGEVYKIGTVELSYPCYEKLIKDLEKDALREEILEQTRKSLYKLAKTSTYGIGGCHLPKLSDMNTKEKMEALELLMTRELDVRDLYPNLYPSVALYSKPATFKVDDYFIKHYQIVDGKITKAAVVRAKEEPKLKVMFNGPATIFQYGDFKTVVKCDEEDKFDRLVGLGVALYRYYRQHINYKKQYQTLSYFMDLDELAHYALHQFCDHSVNKKENLAKELKKHDEGTWITLDI